MGLICRSGGRGEGSRGHADFREVSSGSLGLADQSSSDGASRRPACVSLPTVQADGAGWACDLWLVRLPLGRGGPVRPAGGLTWRVGSGRRACGFRCPGCTQRRTFRRNGVVWPGPSDGRRRRSCTPSCGRRRARHRAVAGALNGDAGCRVVGFVR
jgi:hypothetical protein